jgi:ADP-ribose pyrophosphatase YjhB (NUDIX family)
MSEPIDPNGTTEPAWLTWARALQAIAQSGLHYARDRYDVERYQETRAIAAAMMASGSGEPTPRILELFRRDTGYATPKVDVRGAAFRDDRILLVLERMDGLWSLPGGWADVDASAGACVAREIEEESGYTARAIKLAAVWDRRFHAHHPQQPFSVYKLFFMCELTGGTRRVGHETLAADFFAEDALPDLSIARVTPQQIRRMFEHRRHPELPTDFD